MMDPKNAGAVLEMMTSDGGRPVRTSQSMAYRSQLREAMALYTNVLRGNRYAALRFSEAMTTSDFPNLFGDILNRQVVSAYQEVPYTWSMYAKRGTLNDFRQAKRFRIDGATGTLDGPFVAGSLTPSTQRGGSSATGIEQVTQYPEAPIRDGLLGVVQLYKYGRRIPFAWETMINDDLDALKDAPARLGRAARRTEERKVTELYMTSAGPNTSFFNTANKNVVTGAVGGTTVVPIDNPHLSIDALQQALIIMMNQVDQDGEPISIEAVTLVVPPALKVVAMNILHAAQIVANAQGGTVGLYGSGATQSAYNGTRLLTDNWAKNIVSLAVNYYAPIINTTTGNSAWYLFADPNNGRPAIEFDFLRGHEQPELFMKLPNQVAIGEGGFGPGNAPMSGTSNTNPLEGDFDTDSIHYKVRHCLGGTLLDPICAVASTGVG